MSQSALQFNPNDFCNTIRRKRWDFHKTKEKNLVNPATQAKDVANLEVIQDTRPLKPPPMKRYSNVLR